eukprot:365917-Chlamydomonas_euryale.AAC.15
MPNAARVLRQHNPLILAVIGVLPHKGVNSTHCSHSSVKACVPHQRWSILGLTTGQPLSESDTLTWTSPPPWHGLRAWLKPPACCRRAHSAAGLSARRYWTALILKSGVQRCNTLDGGPIGAGWRRHERLSWTAEAACE